jgi:hypothetical protein
MLTPLLIFPVALGLFYTSREEDRPYFALTAGFLGLATVLAVVGYSMAIVLTDVASNYVAAGQGSVKDSFLNDGEMLQSLLLIIGGVSTTPFALGMIGVGVLSLRSGSFPRWLAWPTIVVGVIGLIPFIGFAAIVPGRILWLLISGVMMLQKARTGESPASAASPRESPMPA